MFEESPAAGAVLAEAPPGPECVAALAGLDLDTLPTDGQLDVLVAIERQVSWLHGMQQRVLAGIDDRIQATRPSARAPVANLAREEVGCALRLAPGTAADRLAVAGTLCDRLPATLHALEAGEITYWHARALAEVAIRVDPVAAARLEQAVLPEAGDQTVGRFRTAVAGAATALDPAYAEDRRHRALADRCVRIRPAGDGLASLWALLPAEGAAALDAAVTALASVTSAGDPRTCDQRRADALVDLGAAALHDPALPRAQGLRPQVQVTISLSTLLGLDEHPAELAGHGPIPAELARRIAADPTGSWRRLVLDPVHHRLLDYGRRTYRPPADLARYVTRDRLCVFPQCQRNAARCDLDHQIRYADGGTTDAQNIAPLCPRHHAVKDDGGWQVTRQPDGDYHWTSPTSRSYTVSTPLPEPPRHPHPSRSHQPNPNQTHPATTRRCSDWPMAWTDDLGHEPATNATRTSAAVES